MLKGFKEFILKGNVVDLAVAVVIGAAFSAVVNSVVKDLVTPLIGAFGGTHDFSALAFTINGSKFMIGEFINALISFLSVSAVIYYAVVTPMNKITQKMHKGEVTDPSEKACPECLSLIPINAKRCKFCTAVLQVEKEKKIDTK